jgi:hypothetical protein
MKIAVVGSRHVLNASVIQEVLNTYLGKMTVLITGGAKGVDTLAERWARENDIPVEVYLPDWKNLGRAAGIVRNRAMVMECHECIAFWDGISKGTKSTIEMCKKQNKRVVVFTVESSLEKPSEQERCSH